MGTKVSISLMEENQVKAYHENERLVMRKILDKYIRTCEQEGVIFLSQPHPTPYFLTDSERWTFNLICNLKDKC